MDSKKETVEEFKNVEEAVKAIVPELEIVHKFSYLNRDSIEKEAVLCGCFYCCEIFLPDKIVEWCDKSIKRGGDGIRERTALCPFCGIDSVLSWFPESHYPVDKNFLDMMSAYFFSQINT